MVKQNDEMIGNTYLSVLASTADNPICFAPHMVWVKFGDQPPCQMDIKHVESIEEFCERHKLTSFATKQNGVKLKGDNTLYQLTTLDNPILLTPLKFWVKIEGGEPIQLDAKRNETVGEFMIRHKKLM